MHQESSSMDKNRIETMLLEIFGLRNTVCSAMSQQMARMCPEDTLHTACRCCCY